MTIADSTHTSAEESHLLHTLADIREALGVGAKPMLDELPGLVRGMADRIKELEDYGNSMEEVYAELGARTQFLSDRLVKVKAERDELARALLSGPHHCPCPKFCNTVAGQERLPHFPGCPVALAERIVKEAGDGR